MPYNPTNKMPSVKQTAVVPSDFHVQFTITPFPKISENYKETVRLLVEHMDIVAESRKLIAEGKTIKWEDFQKQHGTTEKR